MRGDVFSDVFSTENAQTNIDGVLWGSIHALTVLYCETHCHYRIKQTWESASSHFAMQMLQWEKSVCQCDSYSVVHRTSKAKYFLRGLLQTAPGCLCVHWSCLPICFYFSFCF